MKSIDFEVRIFSIVKLVMIIWLYARVTFIYRARESSWELDASPVEMPIFH